MRDQSIPANNTCVICGALLIRGKGEAPCRLALRKTCGGKCRAQLATQTRYATGDFPTRVELTCRQCGTSFTEKPSHLVSYYGFERQFCSRACKDAAKRGTKKPIEETAAIPFVCAECGRAGLGWPSVPRKYCSRACANVANNRTRNSGKTTGIERAVYHALDEAGLCYIAQHPIEWMVVDAYLPELNLVIECQGDFFHCNPAAYPEGPTGAIQIAVTKRDASRRKWLRNRGYRLVELWESDINSVGAKALIEARVLS